MKLLNVIPLLSILFVNNAWSQDDDKTIYYHNIYFKDAYANKDFTTALSELTWLVVNDPEPDENLFIRGSKVYDEILKSNLKDERRSQLQEHALQLYQYRLERFGKDSKVVNIALTKAYKYWVSRPDKLTPLFEKFQNVMNENPDEVSSANMLAFMDILNRLNRTNKALSKEEVINKYDEISSIIESRTDIVDDSDYYMSKIDGLFLQMVKLDCTEIEERFGRNLETDSDAIDKSKLYLKMCFKMNCRGSDSFTIALDHVLAHEPSSSLLLFKAKTLMGASRYDEAESMYGKALTFEMEPETESDIYLNLARIYTVRDNKPEAQVYAFKAIESNDNEKAHSIIGSLYMASFYECAEDKDIVQKRGVYLAAYKHFQKAGDAKNMAIAKSNFPSSEEIFMNGYNVGETLNVDCWFHESVVIDKRN